MELPPFITKTFSVEYSTMNILSKIVYEMTIIAIKTPVFTPIKPIIIALGKSKLSTFI